MMFLYKKNMNYHLLINLLFLLFLFSEYVIFLILNEFHLKFIESQLLIVFLYSMFSMRKLTSNWLSIYVMFLSFTGLFLFVRPFFHLFGWSDAISGYGEAEWNSINLNFAFNQKTFVKINFILLFSILSMNIGFLLGFKKYISTNFNQSALYFHIKIFNVKIAYLIYFIGLFSFLIKVYLYVLVLRDNGYFYLYSGKYTLPLLVRIFDDFFYIGYLLIMMNMPIRKRGYLISLMTVVIYSTSLLTGMRGEFFTVFFSIIFLLSLMYKWKIGLFYILIFGFLLILLGQSVLMIKFSNVTYDFTQIFDLLKVFLYSQGVSILVLGYVIEFSDLFVDVYQGFRYFISPFVSIFLTLTGQKQSRELSDPTVEYNLSDQLSYFIDIDKYRAGGGYGSGYIVELFAFGGDIIFVIVGCLLLGYFISYLSYKFVYKKYGLFILMMLLPILFWLPRASIMSLGKRYLFAILIIFCLTVLYQSIRIKRK